MLRVSKFLRCLYVIPLQTKASHPLLHPLPPVLVVENEQRAPSELSAYQKKSFEIDDHVGITIAGLSSDARVLARFMRTEYVARRCTLNWGEGVERERERERETSHSNTQTLRNGKVYVHIHLQCRLVTY